MKLRLLLSLALLSATLTSGCKTYNYQLAGPANLSQTITSQSVSIHYDPLDYRLARHRDRLAMRIINPTGDSIQLLGNRSFVVDPKGETHPVRGKVIAPHSYARMLLPPIPQTYEVTPPGWAGPGYDIATPYYRDDIYGGLYGPATTTYQVRTPYDWKWTVGAAHLRLAYERNGATFNHDFVFVREPAK